jgi:hypothetical protein
VLAVAAAAAAAAAAVRTALYAAVHAVPVFRHGKLVLHLGPTLYGQGPGLRGGVLGCLRGVVLLVGVFISVPALWPTKN